ncbi:hypothetical protein TNCV_338591 [Trichonephila clavipes]|nr:hypothetical protein TNCV_338591 [Trichonephila clavipes]
MKQKEDLKIKHLLENELREQFIDEREALRNEAKENIQHLQDENKKQYNKHRKPAYTTNKFSCSPSAADGEVIRMPVWMSVESLPTSGSCHSATRRPLLKP